MSRVWVHSHDDIPHTLLEMVNAIQYLLATKALQNLDDLMDRYMSDMTHSHVRHDSFPRAHMTYSHEWIEPYFPHIIPCEEYKRGLFTLEEYERALFSAQLTHSHEWIEGFIVLQRLDGLIDRYMSDLTYFMCDMTHPHVWHYSFFTVWHIVFVAFEKLTMSWIGVWDDMMQSHVRHDSFPCVHMTHSHVWYHSFIAFQKLDDVMDR